MDNHGLIKPGFILFLDGLIGSFAGWLFWLVITQYATPHDVGQVVSLTSLVGLLSAFVVAGFDYATLKETFKDKSKVYGSLSVLELMLHLALIPIVLVIAMTFYQTNSELNIFLALAIMITSGVGIIPKYAILGILDSKTIFVIDMMGVGLKFGAGIALAIGGFGSTAILIALLVSQGFMTLTFFVIARGKFGFSIGDAALFRRMIKIGLSNTPGKVARVISASLSIILLSSIGVDSADIGIFYVALMLSYFAAGIGPSLSMMAMPASTISGSDITSVSTRLGLNLASPLIAMLISAPAFFLSLINQSYLPGKDLVIVFALGVIPSLLVNNALTKLNNLYKLKELAILGVIEASSFLLIFVLLMNYGILGGAVAVVLSYVAAAVYSGMILGRPAVKPIVISLTAVATGAATGTLVLNLSSVGWAASVIGFATAFASIILLKGVSVDELGKIVRLLVAK